MLKNSLSRVNYKTNEPLSKYCTYQIGGPADYFLEAGSKEELLEGLKWAHERGIPVFVFGGGSNLLFDDHGFRGLVFRVRAQGILVDGERITAEAGAPVSKMVMAALEAGLTGMEAWHGLPGTVGGGVVGNAGCFGVETKDLLEKAEVFWPSEGVKEMTASELEYAYRDSLLKERQGQLMVGQQPRVVLSATYKLKKGDRAAIQAKMNEILRSRAGKQPPGCSTGSFFKNPSPEKPAGWLIEQCGLKGRQVGKAKISDRHANFLMNTGGATAKEILELAELAKKAVSEKFGIELEQEVVFVPAE